jgi:fructokinase
VRDGQPEYTINDSQAYDAIDAAEALTALGENPAGMLYHGSLALRSDGSREALDELAGRLAGEIFVDVNLRQPWWQKEQVRADLSRARWAKLNDEELRELSSQPAHSRGGLLEQAAAFRKELDLEVLFLTLGGEGAVILGPAEEVLELPAAAAGPLVDTVGAGDAFTAVAMLGLSTGWPGAVILERAVQFAAAACCLEGATTSRREHYGGFLQGWGLQEDPGSLRG